MTFAQQINAALGSTITYLSPDGKMHRFPTNGKSSDTAGWYVMPTPDVVVAGCWRSGKTITLFEDGKRKDDPDVVDAIQRARAAYRKEREIAAKEAANKAVDLMHRSKALDYTNPYIVRKAIDRMPRLRGKLRARTLKESVLVDMINAHGEIVGAQIINADGSKKFLSGTAKQGAWHWLLHEPTMNNLSRLQRDVFERRRQDDIIAVVEGLATGCAVAEMRGLLRVAVAFDAGNLLHVAKRLLVLYPHNPIVIFADDDDINPKTGKQSGKAGAEAACALDPQRIGIDYPLWRDGKKPEGASDFNDLFIDSIKNKMRQ